MIVYFLVSCDPYSDGRPSTDSKGTDHPFFPPLNPAEEKWPSVETNYTAIANGLGGDSDAARAILGGNAVRILGLDVCQGSPRFPLLL